MVAEDNEIVLEKSTPTSIAAAVNAALALDAGELERRKIESLCKVQEFRWEKIAEKTLNTFHQILETRH